MMATDELRKALGFMRIWLTEDAHLGESAISRELEKAEGLRKLDAIEQAIAATLGRGECERTTTRNGKFKTKYGRKVPLCECCGYAIGDDRYNFCPKCGAKIVEAVKR